MGFKWKWVLALPCMCAVASIGRTTFLDSFAPVEKVYLRTAAAKGYKPRTEMKRELVTPIYNDEESRRLQDANVTTFDAEIYIKYDDKPEHIGWSLTDYKGRDIARRKSWPGETGEKIFSVPLTPGKYAFEMTDSMGDGLCCFGNSSGSYELIVNTKTLITGGEFGYTTGKLYIKLYSTGFNKLVPFVDW